MKQRIAIIDYGMGNLHSAASALAKVAPEAEIIISAEDSVIRSADRIVFPGVGAIGDCMQAIKDQGVDSLLKQEVSQKPVLAICVGMQALMNTSEESSDGNCGTECIGLIPGRVKYFGDNLTSRSMELYSSTGDTRLKVPHMGWNQVTQTIDHPLWQGIKQDDRFYFVHSYYVEPNEESCIAGTCEYGVSVTSALSAKNLFAVQFHPEKSHQSGLKLLENFSYWNGLP